MRSRRHRRQDLALLGLRLGLGFVFVAFGAQKLLQPGEWVIFVPPWVGTALRLAGDFGVDRLMRFQGFLELTIGMQLLAGAGTRAAAGAGTGLLLAIVAILGFNPLAVRDVGIAAGLLALLVLGPGRLSLDVVVWRRRKARPTAGVLPSPLWAVGQVAVLFLFLGAPGGSDPALEPGLDLEALAGGPIPPLPQRVSVDAQKVDLGRLLFNDPRLSRNSTIACASCHSPRSAGADGRIVSMGVDGQLGDRNAPTVLNAGFNLAQFWDGRAATLEEQAGGPITNPLEMDNTWPEVLARLRSDRKYAALFAEAYPDGITEENVRHALAEFQRSLITPDAPFDRFLRGDAAALTAQQVRGWERFRALGCITCHQGSNVGGNLFQVMGRMRGFFDDRPARTSDLGRFNVTGREEDRHKFRVPPLRNVRLTAPYFHDGSISDLEEAIRIMARHQLGYELAREEVADLVAFLDSLSGTIPPI